MSRSSTRRQDAILKEAGWICHSRIWPQTWYAQEGPAGPWTFYGALNYISGEQSADERGAQHARTVDLDEVRTAIANHPTLTSNGFDGADEIRSRVTYRNLPTSLLPTLLAKVQLAHDFLIRLKPLGLTKISPHSFRLKLQAEDWAGRSVSNGEVILAATVAGLAVEPFHLGPNARIGVMRPVWLDGRQISASVRDACAPVDQLVHS